MTRRYDYHAPSSVLGFLLKMALLVFLLWSGWQTWLFVNWVFPEEEIGFRALGMINFDIMAFFWLSLATFYRFWHYRSRTLVLIAAGITGTLSVIASFIMMSIQGFYRFHLPVSTDIYNISVWACLAALFVNLLISMRVVVWEEEAKHEAKVNHQRYIRHKSRITQNSSVTQQQQQQIAQNSVTRHASVTDIRKAQSRARSQRYRQNQKRKKGQFLP